jgi:hypothetical protein
VQGPGNDHGWTGAHQYCLCTLWRVQLCAVQPTDAEYCCSLLIPHRHHTACVTTQRHHHRTPLMMR